MSIDVDVDVIVVGGGQAGLAASYAAQQRDLRAVVLEATDAVGNSWSSRYDSLHLFTPRSHSSLPGMLLPGDPLGYPGRDEIVDYLQAYAETFRLPIAFNQTVIRLTHDGTTFTASTASRQWTGRAVVVATGPFQTPSLPSWTSPADGVLQLHSSQYRGPEQLRGDSVLVVGGGNSGAQIAEELAQFLRVDFAVSSPLRFLPSTIAGRSIFWWLDVTGALNAPAHSMRARALRKRGDPIVGASLRTTIRTGAVRMRPAAVSIEDGRVRFEDGATSRYDTIIYSTGYRSDFGWIEIAGATDEHGNPAQSAGISDSVPGLHFLGLGWLRSRNSALIGGVGADAAYIIDHVRRELTEQARASGTSRAHTPSPLPPTPRRGS